MREDFLISFGNEQLIEQFMRQVNGKVEENSREKSILDTETAGFEAEFDTREISDESQLLNTESDHSYTTQYTRYKKLFKTQEWRYIIGIVATSSLGSFLWGYSFSVVAGAMLLIDDHFNLTILWHETIVSMLVAGATVGAAIAGTLNDKFGRWKVMMISAMLHVVAAVVMALAFSKVYLVIGRTIAGLAIGIV